MTKLLEWISVLSTAGAVWLSLVGGYVKSPLLDKWMPLIYISPLIFVVIFGISCVFIVLYRVFTFKDCEEAAKELQEEIKEARRELSNMGFQW